MVAYAAQRSGRFGLYFETGQGADATNGHGAGFDMVIHESRKYGFARALRRRVGEAQAAAGRGASGQRAAPWVCLNDVAGFIGPEVFRTREQLVRCCLEDTVMGKLHGLPIGLDICSTLHMDVDLADLDWCIEQVMPANPAYLMALPTKNDPMLSYLTTAFQDHVRIRERFGYRVDDAMWAFFQKLGVIGQDGRPTAHFGDPLWVYLQYRRAQGDARGEAEIRAEGEGADRRMRGARGVHRPRPRHQYLGSGAGDGRQGAGALRRRQEIDLGRAAARLRQDPAARAAGRHPLGRPRGLHPASADRREAERRRRRRSSAALAASTPAATTCS